MKKQKLVRTYPNNYTNPTSNLSALLNEGYVVVMCNEFEVSSTQKGLEYILEKDDEPKEDVIPIETIKEAVFKAVKEQSMRQPFPFI